MSDRQKYIEVINKFICNTIGEAKVSSGSQCILTTDTTKLDLFTIHNLNRNINESHVQEMKKEIASMHMKKRFVILTVAIDINEVISAYEEHVKDDNFLDFCKDIKYIIIDGQHRYTALQRLISETTDPIQILVICYLLQGDIQINELVEDINKNLPMKESDIEEIQKKRNFREIFTKMIPEHLQNKRCIRNIINSVYLKSKHLSEYLKVKESSDIKNDIYKISKNFEETFNEMIIDNPKFEQSAIGETIKSCGLYQLIQYPDPQWLNDLPITLTQEPVSKKRKL